MIGAKFLPVQLKIRELTLSFLRQTKYRFCFRVPFKSLMIALVTIDFQKDKDYLCFRDFVYINIYVNKKRFK